MIIRYPAKNSTFGIKSTIVPIIGNYDKNGNIPVGIGTSATDYGKPPTPWAIT